MVAPFDAAWSILKALEEQQMLHPAGHEYDISMHPVIQGMLARRGIDPHDLRLYHLARRGAYPEGFDLPMNFRAADTSFGVRAERERRSRGDLDAAAQMSRGSVFDLPPDESGEGGIFNLPFDAQSADLEDLAYRVSPQFRQKLRDGTFTRDPRTM